MESRGFGKERIKVSSHLILVCQTRLSKKIIILYAFLGNRERQIVSSQSELKRRKTFNEKDAKDVQVVLNGIIWI